jgi:hypothetical protein
MKHRKEYIQEIVMRAIQEKFSDGDTPHYKPLSIPFEDDDFIGSIQKEVWSDGFIEFHYRIYYKTDKMSRKVKGFPPPQPLVVDRSKKSWFGFYYPQHKTCAEKFEINRW